MNNQPLPWNNQELLNWKEFWSTDTGKEAIKHFENIAADFASQELTTVDPNTIAAIAGRRAGIRTILDFIQIGINQANEVEKGKEKTADKK